MVIRNAKGIQFKNSTISVKAGPRFSAENAEVEGLENPKNKLEYTNKIEP
jgi:hypothetical protein